ncbi:MAG TPA: hypothetical protein VEJ87_04275, partial [Acidimicrobiales bacterium]|nr:hypothetical protein [Acidimicrobiales bacterium]
AGLTLFALLASSFNNLVADLITLLIVWVAPWTAIFLVDWALRGGRYDPAALLGDGEGRPGRFGLGFRPGATFAMAAGMAASLLCVSTQVFTGSVSSLLDGADLSIPSGMLVAGVSYWLLCRRSVRRETVGTHNQVGRVAAAGVTGPK